MRRIASFLATAGVSPNAISIFGMFAAGGACAALVSTGEGGLQDRVLYLAALAGVQLRLLSNLLDGMVAIEGHRQSATGELYNDVPDRVSDSLILLGAGYAANSSPTLGWAAALLAMFVTYIRVLGAACGVGSNFGGPMAKPHRMAALSAVCAWMAVTPESWRPTLPAILDSPRPGPVWIVLAAICLGCVVTAIRRLAWIAGRLREARGAPR